MIQCNPVLWTAIFCHVFYNAFCGRSHSNFFGSQNVSRNKPNKNGCIGCIGLFSSWSWDFTKCSGFLSVVNPQRRNSSMFLLCGLQDKLWQVGMLHGFDMVSPHYIWKEHFGHTGGDSPFQIWTCQTVVPPPLETWQFRGQYGTNNTKSKNCKCIAPAHAGYEVDTLSQFCSLVDPG